MTLPVISSVTPYYLVWLFFITGVMYGVFLGYGKLLRPLYSPLPNLVRGFLAFVAVNELLALPFVLLHLSFSFFLITFLLLNVSVLVAGILNARKGLLKFMEWRPSKSSYYLILPAITILGCLLFTQFYVKYDADDSTYVSLVQQNMGSSRLYSHDPSTADPKLPFSASYQFEGWEIIESSIAKIFGLTALEVTHGLVPILSMPLVFVLLYRIFRELSRNDRVASIATMLLGVFILFGGYSLYSQGTFLLTRSWQGKALVATLIIPGMLYLFNAIFKYPRRNSLYIDLLILNIAALALNPSSIFLGIAATTAFGLLVIINNFSLEQLLKLAATIIPLVAAGIAETFLLGNYTSGGGFEGGVSAGYSTYLTRFVGSSWYFAIWIVGSLILYKAPFVKKSRPILYWLPLFLFITYLNPIFASFVIKYASGNTYWRLFWLLPIMIAVPLIGGYAAEIAITSLKNTRRYVRLFTATAMAALMTVIYVLAGSFVFNTARPLVAYDNSRQKTPDGVAGVAFYLERAPERAVLASTDPAAYLHTFTSKDPLIVSRSMYLSVFYKKNSMEFTDRSRMFAYINGTNPAMAFSEFSQLLHKYGVGYLVYPQTNINLKNFVKNHGLTIVFSNARYEVATTG